MVVKMVAGTNNCPFCDEEVFCVSSCECVCTGETFSHWPFCEQYKCPHCGIFNMCIDRRCNQVQTQLRGLQSIASEENIEANQREKYNFWVDRPIETGICSPEIKKAIKKGLWIVRQINC
jgi:hypothetical protein